MTTVTISEWTCPDRGRVGAVHLNGEPVCSERPLQSEDWGDHAQYIRQHARQLYLSAYRVCPVRLVHYNGDTQVETVLALRTKQVTKADLSLEVSC